MSFKETTPEEYQRLINNKIRIFYLTFKTPEVLNKYRNDKDIYEEIKYSEKQNEKLKDYDKVFHESLDKYFIENTHKKKIEEVLRYNYNIIKKKEKELEDTNKELKFKDEKLEDKDKELKFKNEKLEDKDKELKFKNEKLEDKDKELKFKNEELEDKDDEIKELRNTYIRNKYGNRYNFDSDINILKSFETIFNENNISYNPYKKSRKTQVRYLLNKLENDTRVDKKLYNYFHDTLKEKKKLSLKIQTRNIDIQEGEGLLNTNKFKVNTDLLSKNILSIRYLTGKILTNKLLKDNYKISKNMVNAIKFNKNVHKLSKNEKNVYYELQKYLNKGQDINVLIGSYLAGNNSKDLFNKINKILYDKYKNNLINQKEYTNLLSKINKV